MIGGTGTGKTHWAIAIAGRQGRIADHLTRMDFVILDELGYLPWGIAI